MGYFPCCCPEDPQRQPSQTIPAIALCCPGELEGKILLLKTPLVLATGYVEIELVLASKFPLCWVSFIELEGSMQRVVWVEEESQQSLTQL